MACQVAVMWVKKRTIFARSSGSCLESGPCYTRRDFLPAPMPTRRKSRKIQSAIISRGFFRAQIIDDP
jgi:hypothetical protein